MSRRITLALIAAVLYGGFFVGVYRAFGDESWPEW